MAKKKREPIKWESYIRVNGHFVCVQTLNPEQKEYVAERLKCEFMNGLLRGKAVFHMPEDAPTPQELFPEYYNDSAPAEAADEPNPFPHWTPT